jgi:hypothetical protein
MCNQGLVSHATGFAPLRGADGESALTDPTAASATA